MKLQNRSGKRKDGRGWRISERENGEEYCAGGAEVGTEWLSGKPAVVKISGTQTGALRRKKFLSRKPPGGKAEISSCSLSGKQETTDARGRDEWQENKKIGGGDWGWQPLGSRIEKWTGAQKTEAKLASRANWPTSTQIKTSWNFFSWASSEKSRTRARTEEPLAAKSESETGGRQKQPRRRENWIEKQVHAQNREPVRKLGRPFSGSAALARAEKIWSEQNNPRPEPNLAKQTEKILY
jgi:hypothetical protein